MQSPLREPTAQMRETPGAAVGDAPFAAPTAREWARNLAIALAAGVFLALVGAMSTADLPLMTRLLFWSPLMLGGAVAGHFMGRIVGLIPRAASSRWLFGALLAFALAVPVTFLVSGYGNLFFRAGMRLPALLTLFPSVLVISTAMTAIMIAVSWPGRVTHQAPGAPARAPFLERLPPKLKGAALYAVSAEDHYLRLHTSKGNDLILMRMTDAVRELDGLEGAQTHRSWWVARDAVEGAQRRGDKLVLQIKGGGEAPVSRPNVRALREAGWF